MGPRVETQSGGRRDLSGIPGSGWKRSDHRVPEWIGVHLSCSLQPVKGVTWNQGEAGSLRAAISPTSARALSISGSSPTVVDLEINGGGSLGTIDGGAVYVSVAPPAWSREHFFVAGPKGGRLRERKSRVEPSGCERRQLKRHLRRRPLFRRRDGHRDTVTISNVRWTDRVVESTSMQTSV